MTTLLERLADIGARPGDPDDERLRAGASILAPVDIATISSRMESHGQRPGLEIKLGYG